MEWPFGKKNPREQWKKIEKKESDLTSKRNEASSEYEKASPYAPFPDSSDKDAALAHLGRVDNRLYKTQLQKKSMYEKSHGEALDMEKQRQKLVQEIADAEERLRTFEAGELDMHKKPEETERQ